MTLTSNNQHEILITISDASLETTDEETLTYFRIKQEFQKGCLNVIKNSDVKCTNAI